MKFRDKTVIVTGSSRGIGRTIAGMFMEEGARVVINGRNPEQLRNTQVEFQSMGYQPLAIPGDVTDPGFCRKLVEQTVAHFDRLDYLINNAGLPMRGFFEELTPEFFKKVIDVNLMSAVYCTMAALPFIKQTRGSVVFISSLSGGIRGIPNSAPYSVGKMGLTALAQTLQSELRHSGVHFGLVRVGFVKAYPGKKVLKYDNSLMEVHRRGHETEEDVGRAVMRLIRRRKFKITQTLLGKALSFFQWIAPGFVNWALYKTLNHKMYR
ncbi:MAG: SDR family NAD(P)-dependent oxidoreductase [Bacteroidales bacterium]|nr:SDR family NAD(P)-dependent oxidoreductase [Bacteroidales bacterium]